MARFIAFLRAVNVGSARRVAMGDVRTELEALGHTEVESFANSGNLVFTATGKAADLEAGIRAALEKRFGWELTTFVRPAARLRKFMQAQPFGDIAGGHTYFALFTLDKLSAADAKRLEALSNDRDEIRVLGGDVHWLIRAKSTQTSLGPKVWRDALPDNPTTARNTTLLARLVKSL